MILSDAKYMPFKQSSFDLITCFETIEHLYNPELMINEAYRILKPNGVFIISTPIPGLFSFYYSCFILNALFISSIY
ncbi:MAG: class I SAM-dependent methyltransferase [Candidatus Bathyarchaeia archaeon]